MLRRGIGIAVVAAVVTCALAGCQQAPAGSFTGTVARADVAAWTKQAIEATHAPASAAATKLAVFDNCRSDSGLLPTSTQWRTVTAIRVSGDRVPEAMRSIESAFEHAHWKVTTLRGIATLTGPANAAHHGLIILQSGGPSVVSISVISPCYS